LTKKKLKKIYPSEIRRRRKVIERKIEKAEKELEELQELCEHSNEDFHDYLGRVRYHSCPDCGWDDSGGLVV
jgi:hypothetical protein